MLGNENRIINYKFNCFDFQIVLLLVFGVGVMVRNFLYFYEEYIFEFLIKWIDDNEDELFYGCLSEFSFFVWGFKVFVFVESWVGLVFVIIRFFLGYDYCLEFVKDGKIFVEIQIYFLQEMDCEGVFNFIEIIFNMVGGVVVLFNRGFLRCKKLNVVENFIKYVGQVVLVWEFVVIINFIFDGIYCIIVWNVIDKVGMGSMGLMDYFLL